MDGVTLLRQARTAGLAVVANGDKLVIRGPKHAERTALLLLANKPTVMAALGVDWRARHKEALAYWGTFRTAEESAWLAWGELLSRCHRLHSARVPEWQCAGCGEPIGGLKALVLADRNRVHFDDAHGLDCLFAFGARWRGEATAGLRALGLDPPPDSEAR